VIRVRHKPLSLQTGLFIVLIAFTMVTFGLAEGSAASWNVVGCLVLLIAFVKLRLVGVHFMEIGHAPVPLRVVFDLYVVATCATLLTLYLVTG